MVKVFAVGVGPGSKNYVTETVRKTVESADVLWATNTHLKSYLI